MKYIIILFIAAAINYQAPAQGCVAIKGISGSCSWPADTKSWELNLNTRYFRSYKHFVGRRTIDTGIHQQGDAAFSDYFVTAGSAFKF